MRYILFLLLVGCTADSVMRECEYEAAKTTTEESRQTDIVDACMKAKGYKYDYSKVDVSKYYNTSQARRDPANWRR